MTLSAGARLGPYEIVAPIGAGGMGEVYKARDTRLNRVVAVKVLPPRVASRPEWRQRFEREARAVSSLNHAHICTLHDIGEQEGIHFLVMEFLDGETLSSRLARGRLPADQVLRYGIEMADALAQAHRQGVFHRDLKPGNIMLTRGGSKLLDFGLAKLRAPEGGPPGVAGLSSLPTESDPLTQQGTLLGTMQYMSPEQLQGKEADGRSDLFAFGAVLFEMAAGKRAFRAESPASLIAAILSAEPLEIPGEEMGAVAPGLDRVVKGCLVKDPEERWQSAHDVWIELKWVAEGRLTQPAPSGPATQPAPASWRERLFWPLAAAATLAALALAAALWLRGPANERSLKLFVLPPEKSILSEFVAISPDGRQLAFVAITEGRSLLYLRPLDSVGARALPGTEGAFGPFWSPDSRSVGFFAGGKLKRVEVTGGPPQTLCEASQGGGGSWSREGVIVFAPSRQGGLYRVSSAGGQPAVVTRVDETRRVNSHRWPHFLPDGRRFLYYARAAERESAGVYVGSLDSPPDSRQARRLIGSDSLAVYTRPGHLLFARDRALMAQAFDAEQARLSGEPFPLAEKLAGSIYVGFAAISASDTGVLAYRTGAGLRTQLTWFDRSGKPLGTAAPPGEDFHFALSPDERRAAAARRSADQSATDIWLADLSRASFSRFTLEPAIDWAPVWSPDGRRIVFASDREGPYNLYWKDSSGAGNEELLLKTGEIVYSCDWSRDGRFIAYEARNPKTGADLWVLPLGGDRKPVPFLRTSFWESRAQFSPDGRWIAYMSDESGRNEVYVQSFAGIGGAGVSESGGKWPVSTEGGAEPKWRRDGKELFYLAADQKLMAVEVRAAAGFQSGVPRALFETRLAGVVLGSNYAVAADGKRFLINNPVEAPGQAVVTVVINPGLK